MAEGKGHTELLPCPFCGGDSDRICNGLGWPVVECNQCGARGPCIHRSAESGEYIEDWNTRAADKARSALSRFRSYQNGGANG